MMSPGTVFVPPYRMFRDKLPAIVYHGLDNATVCSLSIPSMSNTVQLVGVPTQKDASTVSSSVSSSARTLGVGAMVNEMRTNENIVHIMVEGGPAMARAFLSTGLVDGGIVAVGPMTFIEQYHSGKFAAVLENAGLSLLESHQLRDKNNRNVLLWSGMFSCMVYRLCCASRSCFLLAFCFIRSPSNS